MQPWGTQALYTSQTSVEVTLFPYAIIGSPTAQPAISIAARRSSGPVRHFNPFGKSCSRCKMHKEKNCTDSRMAPTLARQLTFVCSAALSAVSRTCNYRRSGPAAQCKPLCEARAPLAPCCMLMLTCRLAVCRVRAQAACCCSSLRWRRPRRSWRLQSIVHERMLPHSSSWASHRRCHSPRPLYSSWCSAVLVAFLDVLECCMMMLSVSKCGYRCVPVGDSVGNTRGSVGSYNRALGDMLLRCNAKT